MATQTRQKESNVLNMIMMPLSFFLILAALGITSAELFSGNTLQFSTSCFQIVDIFAPKGNIILDKTPPLNLFRPLPNWFHQICRTLNPSILHGRICSTLSRWHGSTADTAAFHYSCIQHRRCNLCVTSGYPFSAFNCWFSAVKPSIQRINRPFGTRNRPFSI